MGAGFAREVNDAQKLMFQDLGVRSFPYFLLVDEQGVIVGERGGVEMKSDVSQVLHDWIQELRSPTAK